MADGIDDLRGRLDELIDGYRLALHECVDGLTEAEARTRRVPSTTTRLGRGRPGSGG